VVCCQNGFTALHLASQDGHDDMAGLLIERGADVNWIAKNGLTSLHLTAQEDAVPVADILVQNAAQIDPKTKVDRPASPYFATCPTSTGIFAVYIDGCYVFVM